jgi:ABC-2 type transport system permease protein
MSARRVLAIAVRILAQIRRDHRTLLLMFGVPLLILWLLAYLTRGPAARPHVALVNQDSGPLGALVVAQVAKAEAFDVLRLDEGAADRALREGRVAAVVMLPRDLSLRLLSERVLAPEVRLDGSVPGLGDSLSRAFDLALLGAVRGAVAGLAGRDDIFPRVAPHIVYLGVPGELDLLDQLGAAFVGLVAFFVVFVVTSVSFLRERSQGTLERMLATPTRRGEIALGYMLPFALLAIVQGAVVLAFTLKVLRVFNAGNVALIFLVQALLAVVAVNLGIFLSVFARTEFQAVQFIPLVIVPQLALSGIILPVAAEPAALQVLSRVLPLTYAVSALRAVMIQGATLASPRLGFDLAVLAGFALLLIVLAAATLRRRVA